MALISGQFQLGNVVFGEKTMYPVDVADFGPPDLSVNDVPRPSRDGLRMGRETRQGRQVTFDMAVIGSTLGEPGGQPMFDRLADLEREWANEPARDYAALCKPLSYCRGGETRRVYGRPRRFAPIYPDQLSPWINVTCDYQTLDHYSYSETLYYTYVGSGLAKSTAGVRFPVRFPLSMVSTGQVANPNPITITGTAPAWIRLFMYGPCINPTVEIVGAYKVSLPIALRADEYVIVDPTPWGQIVRRSDSANLAGYLSYDTPVLSKMRLAPGRWRVNWLGQDRTGTSRCYVDWRTCWHGL